MTRLRYIFLAAMATMLMACSSDYVYEHSQEEILPEIQTLTISLTEDEQLVLMQMRNPNNRICIDEATETALDAISFFNGATTRSVAAQVIAGVTALRSEPTTQTATRSTDGNELDIQFPDTLAFVFNFANDAGFTIVAADTRIESQILAFTDNGNFENAAEIPGVALFLEGLDAYIEYSIIRAEHLRDSLMAGIMAKAQEVMEKWQASIDTNTRWNCCCTSNIIRCPQCGKPSPWSGSAWWSFFPMFVRAGPWTTTQIVEPLLPVEWGQWFPFNYRVPLLCPNPERPERGGRAPAGCVATATAQLMAFWGHPARIDNNEFALNWHILRMFTARPGKYGNVQGRQRLPQFGGSFNSNEQLFVNQVSEFMLRIGRNIDMHYTCTGSSATTQNAVNWLESLGYTVPRVSWGYDAVAVRNSITNRRPVLIEGWTVAGGHLWLLDGFLRQSRVVTTEYWVGWTTSCGTVTIPPLNCDWCRREWGAPPSPPIISTRTEVSPFFIHNNWGWGEAGRLGYPVPNNGNGFFVEGSFEVLQRRFESDGTVGSPGPPPHNFNRSLSTFTNIHVRGINP